MQILNKKGNELDFYADCSVTTATQVSLKLTTFTWFTIFTGFTVPRGPSYYILCDFTKTSQELRMLSSVTINCQMTKIVMNSGSQLSEL